MRVVVDTQERHTHTHKLDTTYPIGVVELNVSISRGETANVVRVSESRSAMHGYDCRRLCI